MFFGRVPLSEAEGGVLAHRVASGAASLAKGVILTAGDCRALAAAGIEHVTIARREAGDVPEDEAAARLAQAVAGEGVRVSAPFTGRSNLFAESDGILVLDSAAIHRFNRVDEAITLATLPPFRRVVAGEMVATVKIIPFCLAERVLLDALQGLGAVPPLKLAPFRPLRIGLISLSVPTLKASSIAKTARVTEARITRLGSRLVFHEVMPHDQQRLSAYLAALDPSGWDLLLIFGAAAISDRRDVIPMALTEAGGRVIHLGMPVDPGNLLLVGTLDGKPVIGAPGCARSPAENGFDWVLERLAAGLTITAADIQAMGVGGLLMEIVSRPRPREDTEAGPA